MASEKSIALVLRVTAFSETSCIGLLFTREFGKLPLIAKGARRPKSPFEAALDVLAVCRIVFLHKSSAMGILTEAKLERRFRNRRQDLVWLYAAYYVVELLKSLLEEGDPHPELFDLAIRTIAELDCAPKEALPASQNDSKLPARSLNHELNLILLRFEVGLLKHLGHFPLLSQCVGCGRERTAKSDVTFGLQAGGVLCPKCRITATNRMQVSPNCIRLLMELSRDFDAIENRKETIHSNDIGVQTPKPDTIQERKFGYDICSLGAAGGKFKALVAPIDSGVFSLDANLLSEIRNLVNQYLEVLVGHEPRVMKFLDRLSKLHH